MPETSLEQESNCWRVFDYSVQIECDRHVLAELDREAIDGFHRLRHGGVEVGGVLVGDRRDHTVTIRDHRTFECEHALGPSFVLSARDHEKLAALLESLRAEGRVAVGWYHSNTRSHIHLSAADIELFDRHFPEPWQIALLLKPDSFAPTKAGFFVREEDGSIRADSGHEEFSLPPRNDPASVRKTDREILMERAAMSMPPALPRPEIPTKAPLLKPVLTGALAAVAMALLVVWFAGKEKNLTPQNTLGLTLRDDAGHLQIVWNRAATPITRYPGGILEIKDGERVRMIDLPGDQLQRGTIIYDRASPTVTVNLKVGGTEESAVFVGPPAVDARRQERLREAADITPRERSPRVRNTRPRPKPLKPSTEEQIPNLQRPPARRDRSQ